ncbi:MAG: VWA domain-containing protein [Acidobacteria bacterium]|nr:VWA domain-containing protein [Acidobacteriota bacterium]
MKKVAVLFSLALICLCFEMNFGQARKPAPSDAVKKANQRPAPTPTPTPPATETSSTNGGAVSQNSTGTDEPAETDDSEVITVDTDLVSIPVKVVDRDGRFIGGLTKEDFKVFEDGVEQEVAYFSNEQQPFTVALVLDMSYSAKFKAEEIQKAALAFINQLRPSDRVMVVSFDQDVYIQCGPTNDRKVLQEAIRRTKISFGTSLYDAMDLVINQKLKKISGRKAIVLFSDGVDTSSTKSNDTFNLNDAMELDALIYPIEYDTYKEVQEMINKPVTQQIPLPGTIPPQQKSPLPFPLPTSGIGTADAKGTTAEEYRKADEYLNEMANRTGGRLYKASTLDNLANAFSFIATELRAYYSLGFYPKNSNPGMKHKIKVRTERKGIIVKARDGYTTKKKAEK